MAYTSAPETQTYSTARSTLAFDLNVRNSADIALDSNGITRDAGMVNLVPDKERDVSGKEIVICKTRPRMYGRQINSETGVPRGVYVWEKTSTQIYYFIVIGTAVYTSTDQITWANPTNLITSATNPVGFTEFIDSTNVKKLVLVDGVEGYVFTSNAAGTKITDVDFPSPHLPFPVFLDGYLFLAKTGTGDIYNSDLNDPAVWTAGSFISSELYPDDVQAIVKVNNYLLAIGTQGSEYFYDAANATASPLARYEGASLPFGTYFPYSIAVNKNTVMFLANSNDGEPSFKYIEDFKTKDVPSSFIVSLMNTQISYSFTDASKVRGYFIRIDGDVFYTFKFNGEDTTTTLSNGTFVYCFNTGVWTEFRGYNGSSSWVPFGACFSTFSGKTNLTNYVLGRTRSVSTGLQVTFFALFSYGAGISHGSASDLITGTGDTGEILTEIRTPNLDFDTLNRKTMHRFSVDLERARNSDATASVLLSVKWSDDDYNTYTTPINLNFSPLVDFPFITQLGAFRRRNFNIRYSGPIYNRYRFSEMDINKGQQ